MLARLAANSDRGRTMNAKLTRCAVAGALILGFFAQPAAASDSALPRLQREWWQWAGSIALDANPLIDETGDFCEAGQRGPYWFLTGNGGGTTTRSCTVPKGVKLVMPVITSFCYPEEGYDTDESCIAYVVDVLAGYKRENLTVRLDGEDVPTESVCEIAAAPGDVVQGAPRHCRIHRRADRTLFNFVINKSGFYLSEPGVWRANAANGVWAVIDTAKLSRGEHRIRIRAVGKPGAVIPYLNVVYKLTVAQPVN
jgi:hypothetical protein